MSDFIEMEFNDNTETWDIREEPFATIERKTEEDFEMLQEAFRLLNEQRKGRYRWHDLRKDPEDLPTGDMECLVAIQMEYGVNYFACRCTSGVFHIVWATRIIAWREIEPF